MKRGFRHLLFTTVALLILCGSAMAQSASRAEVLKAIENKRSELQALEKQFLAPAEEDRTVYADFLRQPDTGLIRLLPRETYGKGTALTITGGGAYYSFTRLTHEYGFGSDIELSGGHLSVGFAGADYGMLTTLGDVTLEEFTIDNDRAGVVAAYKVPTEMVQARAEHQRFAKGANIDGALYNSRVPAQVNTSYLLRSINFDQGDVLVAFRVVRQDSDGSVTILWKLLKKYPKPELARARSEQ